MTITTTVTFDDLIAAYDDELEDLRATYDELREWAEDTYGEHEAQWHPDIRTKIQAHNQAAKEIQKRQHALDRIREQYGDGAFELKMLTGEETMAVETELRMDAQQRGVDTQTIQNERQLKVVQKALVDAPEGFPTKSERDMDSGDVSETPDPAAAPAPLTIALYERAENLMNAGAADFTAPGFSDHTALDPSATPTPSEPTPSDTPTSETPSDGSGDDSNERPESDTDATPAPTEATNTDASSRSPGDRPTNPD